MTARHSGSLKAWAIIVARQSVARVAPVSVRPGVHGSWQKAQFPAPLNKGVVKVASSAVRVPPPNSHVRSTRWCQQFALKADVPFVTGGDASAAGGRISFKGLGEEATTGKPLPPRIDFKLPQRPGKRGQVTVGTVKQVAQHILDGLFAGGGNRLLEIRNVGLLDEHANGERGPK